MSANPTVHRRFSVLIRASLSQNSDRIVIRFPFDAMAVSIMQSMPARKFVGSDTDFQGQRGPLWHIPADLSHAQLLRQKFGDELVLDDRLAEWGRQQRQREANLRSMASAETHELKVIPDVLPELHEFCAARPYQLADIAFMAHSDNPLNANAPGLGKTAETIASIFEAELDEGPHLIFCQRSAMEVVWEYELERWQSYEICICDGSAQTRRQWALYARRLADEGVPFWFIMNTQQLGSKHIPDLQMIEWNTLTVDEFHKCGLSNSKTRTSQVIRQFRAKKRIGLSGTPIGGKAEKLWDVLNFLEPQKFTSKWAWYRQWLDLSTNYATGRQEPGQIRRDREQDFYDYHSMFMVRRLRHEVRAELPKQNVQRIWIPFHDASKEQQEQYKEFAAKAEITIEENQLSATSILAEYTRLRQFAIARQNLEIEYRKRSLWNPETESREAAIAEALNVFPTGDCIRKETIERLLGDYGILDNRLNGSHRQALIFSQFTKVVNMLAPWLMDELKLRVGVMTGETSQQSRPKIVRDFEKGGVYDVLLMNTTAGGLSITLNNSDLIIINDETFNPDDQTQAMDRNRDNSADIWILGTGDTIEQHIVHSINQDKRIVNWNILDARRRGLRA